jgi:hypothetical protein
MTDNSGQPNAEEGDSNEDIEAKLIKANLEAQEKQAKSRGNGHGGSQGDSKKHHSEFQPQGSIQEFSVPVRPRGIACGTRHGRAAR